MATDNFFQQTSDQSRVKAAIVAKYFDAWARVIIPSAKKGVGRIAYIDLFAGPGRYEDGTASTPLKILEHAINHPDLRTMLVTRFNDGDANHSRSLEAEIRRLPNIASLTHAPIVHNDEVGDKIVETFEGMRLVPTLFFVDAR